MRSLGLTVRMTTLEHATSVLLLAGIAVMYITYSRKSPCMEGIMINYLTCPAADWSNLFIQTGHLWSYLTWLLQAGGCTVVFGYSRVAASCSDHYRQVPLYTLMYMLQLSDQLTRQMIFSQLLSIPLSSTCYLLPRLQLWLDGTCTAAAATHLKHLAKAVATLSRNVYVWQV